MVHAKVMYCVPLTLIPASCRSADVVNGARKGYVLCTTHTNTRKLQEALSADGTDEVIIVL